MREISGQKVHLLNTHGIGDIVMTLPLIEHLLQSDVKLTMTIKSKVEEEVIRAILLRNGSYDVGFNYFKEISGNGVKGYLKLLRDLRKEKFDISIPTHGADQLKYNILAWCSGAKYRLGLGGKLSFLNHRNIDSYTTSHKTLRNLEVADRGLDLNLDFKGVSIPRYNPDASSIRFLREKFAISDSMKWVALAPGSGEIEKHKRWPVSMYKNLADKLITLGYGVLVLGGPGEEKLGHSISNADNTDKLIDLTGELSISQTLDTLSICACLVANCNGLSHLGSTIEDLKIVGIYGPTSPELTGPYRNDLVIVRQGLDCSPCYRRGYIEGCGNPVCMTDISVDTVLKAVIQE